MWADIVMFDPATIRDEATFENPNQLSDGMQFVLVNGVPVIDGRQADQCAAGQGAARAGIRRSWTSRPHEWGRGTQCVRHEY